VMCTGEASYYRDYKRLKLSTKLATSYTWTDTPTYVRWLPVRKRLSTSRVFSARQISSYCLRICCPSRNAIPIRPTLRATCQCNPD